MADFSNFHFAHNGRIVKSRRKHPDRFKLWQKAIRYNLRGINTKKKKTTLVLCYMFKYTTAI